MNEEEYGPLERQAEELYSKLFPWETEEAARTKARELIAQSKEESIRDGWDKVPDRFGDWLLANANSGDPLLTRILRNARNDGASDEDIRNYWNMQEWERRMITFCDNYFRNAMYLKLKDDGATDAEALIKVNKAYPFYGDPEDTSKCSGPDRPLPFEIKGRVNLYLESGRLLDPAGTDRMLLDGCSSMNAFIREMIKRGIM